MLAKLILRAFDPKNNIKQAIRESFSWFYWVIHVRRSVEDGEGDMSPTF